MHSLLRRTDFSRELGPLIKNDQQRARVWETVNQPVSGRLGAETAAGGGGGGGGWSEKGTGAVGHGEGGGEHAKVATGGGPGEMTRVLWGFQISFSHNPFK